MLHLPERPLIIAHRGASAYRPEHTLASYALAIEMGADFIEPDLVATRDGELVARHENEISGTTDVASRPEFAARRTTKQIDGVTMTGWFTEDFTLAELKTLRARERLPELRPENTAFDGEFPIPTLQEIIDLVRGVELSTPGRRVGIYPETKHPTYFRVIGLPLEEQLMSTLHENGYVGRNASVFVQSFETANLRYLASMTELPLIQLINDSGRPVDFVAAGKHGSYAEMLSEEGLATIAEYAQGIGVHKELIPGWSAADVQPAQGQTLVEAAHEQGLLVHGWTYRAENVFLPCRLRRGDAAGAEYMRQPGDFEAELELHFSLGVDGIFTDFPDLARSFRDEHTAARRRSSVA